MRAGKQKELLMRRYEMEGVSGSAGAAEPLTWSCVCYQLKSVKETRIGEGVRANSEEPVLRECSRPSITRGQHRSRLGAENEKYLGKAAF